MKPIAILCSDLHFSQNAPVARSAESDWFVAQERSWNQIRDRANQDDLPIIIAGDIFDHWKSSPELINFVLCLFSGLRIYAVPGQHDLPNHRYDEMNRSAYGTLVQAGVIKEIEPQEPFSIGEMTLYGFPWGYEIEKSKGRNGNRLNIAVVHKYCWKDVHYLGVSKDSHVEAFGKKLKGYDLAVFGDNHGGFLSCSDDCIVLNCGTMMCRKSDEKNYQPHYGILYDDFTVARVPFDTSKDKWLDQKETESLVDKALDMSNLVSELESLGGDALDFKEMLLRYMESSGTALPTKTLIMKALDHSHGENK